MVKLTVFKGDDKTWNITVSDADGDAIDLSGQTIFFTVKENKTDPDSAALIQATNSTHTSATGGTSTITITNTQSDLDAGNYFFDLQIVSAGSLVTTWVVGDFEVVQEVTRRTSE